MANIFSGVSGTALNILGAARRYYDGIGLSQRAHALTSDYLNQSSSALNKILSLGISQNADTNSLQQRILALRVQTPLSQISKDIIAAKQAEEDAKNADNGAAAASTNGTNVDEEV